MFTDYTFRILFSQMSLRGYFLENGYFPRDEMTRLLLELITILRFQEICLTRLNFGRNILNLRGNSPGIVTNREKSSSIDDPARLIWVQDGERKRMENGELLEFVVNGRLWSVKMKDMCY